MEVGKQAWGHIVHQGLASQGEWRSVRGHRQEPTWDWNMSGIYGLKLWQLYQWEIYSYRGSPLRLQWESKEG